MLTAIGDLVVNGYVGAISPNQVLAMIFTVFAVENEFEFVRGLGGAKMAQLP